MTKEKIIDRMETANGIYGTMFGQDFIEYVSLGKKYRRKDDYIFIKKDKLIEWGIKDEHMGYCFIFEYPGTAYNVYLFSNYGKTWSFDEDDLINGGHKKYEQRES